MVSSRLFIASTTALTLVSLITFSSTVNAHPFPMERDEWGTYLSMPKCAFAPKLNEQPLKKKFSSLNTPKQEQVKISAQRLIHEHHIEKDIAKILNAVASVPSKERDEVCSATASCIRNKYTGYGISWILETVASIPVKEREEIITLVQPFIKEAMDEYTIVRALQAINSIPSKERREIITLVAPLITKSGNTSVLEAAAPLSKQELEKVIEASKSLITKKHTGYDISSILKTVASIPAQEREEVLTFAIPFIKEGKDGYTIKDTLEPIKSIPLGERREIITLVTPLTRDSGNASMLKAAASLPKQELEQVINVSEALIRKLDCGHDISYFFKATASIPTKERAEKIKLVEPLIGKHIRSFDILSFFRAVDNIPEFQRTDVLYACQKIQEVVREEAKLQELVNLFAILQRSPNQELRLSYIEQANTSNLLTFQEYLGYLDSIVPVLRKDFSYESVLDIINNLKQKPVFFNFESVRKVQSVALPEVTPKSGQTVVEDFEKLMGAFDLNNPASETYLGYSAITGDPLDLHMSNEMGVITLIARVRGFVKTLFDLPVDESAGESRGWQMYEDAKPAMKHAIQVIVETLLNADSAQKMQGVVMLFNGLLHCPTGQKEGIDAIVQGLFGNELKGNDVPSRLLQLVGNFRDTQFSKMILESAPNNSQNTHILSFYKELYEPVLGTQTTLKGFRERIGTLNDPFENDPLKPFKLFVEKFFTPITMVKFFLSRIQTEKDLLMIQEISDLEKKIDKIVLTEPKEIQEQITKIEKVIHASQEELNTLEIENPQNPAIGAKKSALELRKKRLNILKTSVVSEEEYLQKVKEREQQVTRLKQLNAEHKKITTFERPFSVLDLYNYMKEGKGFIPSWFKLQTLDTDTILPVALTTTGAIALFERVGLFTDKRNSSPMSSGKDEVE